MSCGLVHESKSVKRVTIDIHTKEQSNCNEKSKEIVNEHWIDKYIRRYESSKTDIKKLLGNKEALRLFFGRCINDINWIDNDIRPSFGDCALKESNKMRLIESEFLKNPSSELQLYSDLELKSPLLDSYMNNIRLYSSTNILNLVSSYRRSAKLPDAFLGLSSYYIIKYGLELSTYTDSDYHNTE